MSIIFCYNNNIFVIALYQSDGFLMMFFLCKAKEDEHVELKFLQHTICYLVQTTY